MIVARELSFHRPQDADAVSALLAELGPEARILAGGTDLVVQMRVGRAAPRHLVDIGGIGSLAAVTVGDDGLRIPANARVTDVVERLGRSSGYQALAEAAICVGSMQVQNRATIVGNVCNASPAADSVPALLVHQAQVEIVGSRPRREPLEAFLIGPGRTALAPGEWVAALRLPTPGMAGSAYVKLGRTRGVDLALVGVACRIDARGTRLAFASVAPTALLIDFPGSVIERLSDEAADVIAARIRPIGDVRASAEYRSAMAVTLAREAWTIAHARLRGLPA
jgi:carbon-monoxide dehydrogenase medium subunit